MSTRRIADFEVLELLGEGAMGQVFKALDINLDRPVAIKLLSNRTIGDKTFLERFRREARLAAKLNHSNIATIYSFGEDTGEPYIAMEFVEGETLEQRIRRKSLSIAEVRKFGEQAASALAAAHELGIIHRDIKPANLMITKGGDLKVMDFGVARRTGETSLTMAGSLIGTANIMAPELIKGNEATSAADLFSLGCVLYECVAGLPAFHGEDPMAVLYKISNEDPTPLKDLRTETPDDLVAIVGGLLIKEPEKRLGPSEVVAARIAGKATPVAANETMALGSGDLGTRVLPEPDTQAGTLVADEGTPGRDGWFKKNGKWLAPAVLVGFVGVILVMKMGGGEPDSVVLGGSDRFLADSLNIEGGHLLRAFPTGRPDNELARGANTFFRRAADADTTFAEPWNNLGRVSIRMGSYKEAIGHFDKALQIDPEYAVAFGNRGEAHEKSSKPEEAERDYLRSLGIRETNKTPYDSPVSLDNQSVFFGNNLGAFLNDQDRFSDAVKILTRVVHQYPDIAPPHKNLARAHLALKQIAQADSSITKALIIDPGYKEAIAIKADIDAAKTPGN